MPATFVNVPLNSITSKFCVSRPIDLITANYTDDIEDLPVAKKWSMKPSVTFPNFSEQFPLLQAFESRPSDIWVVSFPKCGTTWTQEMVWLLDNDLDFDTAKKTFLYDRFPFFEVSYLPNGQKGDTVGKLNEMTEQRYIKSHMPANLLPRSIWRAKCKVIYVARNPKDAAISFYHHWRNIATFTGTLDHFLDMFVNDYSKYTSGLQIYAYF
ncbi:hypothetical protein DMENIID0001_056830 [Sergentomyia squamirostris]